MPWAVAVPPPAGAEDPLTLEVDDHVARWLADAGQQEQAGRWREALALYRRALEKNPNHLCKLEDGLYAGAAEQIARRIARYPPEGIAAYRDEYEALAQGIFDLYRGDRRLAHLERIVRDYFFTTLGDDAAHLLATRLFDEGWCADAITVWDRILRYHPAPSVPPALVAARMAMASRVLREPVPFDELNPRLADLAPIRLAPGAVEGLAPAAPGRDGGRPGAPLTPEALLDAIRKFPLTPSWIAACRPGGEGPSAAGGHPDTLRPPHWLEPPGRLRPVANDVRAWDPYPLFGARGEPSVPPPPLPLPVQEPARSESAPVEHPFLAAAADDGEESVVVVQNGYQILGIDPGTGRLSWMDSTSVPSVDSQFLNHIGSTLFGCVLGPAFQDQGKVVLPVYANMMIATPGGVGGRIGPRTVRCYDARTGKRIWSLRGDPSDPGRGGRVPAAPRGFLFPSPPAVGRSRVYAAALAAKNEPEIYVCAFDAVTGEPLWKTFLCSVLPPPGQPGMFGAAADARWTPCVAEHGGIVYCLTNVGAVAALDGASGHVLWLSRYANPRRAEGLARPLCLPSVSGSQLVVLPQDAAHYQVIDIHSGAAAVTAADDIRHFLGIHAIERPKYRAAVFAGKTSLIFHVLDALPPSEAERREPLAAPATARGTVDRNVLYLPVRGGLLRYDLTTLKVLDDPRPWMEAADEGNLVVAGSALVSVARDRVSAYLDLGRYLAREGAALDQAPPHPGVLLDHGVRLLRSRRFAEADAALGRAVALLEAGRPADDPSLLAAREQLYVCAREQALALMNRANAGPGLLPAVVEHLRRAQACAVREDLRAEAVLLTARAFLTLGRSDPSITAAAAAACQEVIERVPAAMVPDGAAPGEGEDGAGRRTVRASVLAAEGIARMVDAHGREVYRAVENRARQALKDALAGKPETRDGALAAVLERFPNSEAAWEATRDRAALVLREGGGPAAAAAYEAYLAAGHDPVRRAEALLAAADLYGVAGRADLQRKALDRARRACPNVTITEPGPPPVVRDVRAAVEDRLAKLGPAPAVPPPAQPLDVAALREDVLPAVEGIVPRVCVPACASRAAPAAAAPNRLLIARGSLLQLWDLDARSAVWQFPCPRLPDAPPSGQEPPLLAGDVAWLPGGVLAIAWKDRVAAVAPGEEAPRWVFPSTPAAAADKPAKAGLPADLSAEARRAKVEALAKAGAGRITVCALRAGRTRVFVRYVRGADPTSEALDLLQRIRPEVEHFVPAAYRIACLDAATGQVVWERAYPANTTVSAPFGSEFAAPDEDRLVWLFGSIETASPREGIQARKRTSTVQVLDGRTGLPVGAGSARRAEDEIGGTAFDGGTGRFYHFRRGPELQACDLAAGADLNPLRSGRGMIARGETAVAAAFGRVALAHRQGGHVEVWNVEKGLPPRTFRLSALLPGTPARTIDPQLQAPNALLFDGPDVLYVYNVDPARQKGYVTALDLSQEPPGLPQVLWETEGTGHVSNDGGLERGSGMLPATARYVFTYARAGGEIACFDKGRIGVRAKTSKPLVLPPWNNGFPRVAVDGERLIVETEQELKVYR